MIDIGLGCEGFPQEFFDSKKILVGAREGILYKITDLRFTPRLGGLEYFKPRTVLPWVVFQDFR